jgi:CheY-like chemotaxis protein/anti-sigma regulatory factor (Ser/Thr protein kinase)
MLKESSDRLLNAITSYMDISLLTSGSMSVHIKEFYPAKTLRNIYRDHSGQCMTKKLELFIALPDHSDTLLLNTDQELLHKTLSHLLNNAIKFTDKGTIHFGYNAHETELEFFVKDSGIGMNQDVIESIFDRFVKVDTGPTSLTEGSGLGLSIAKGMLDLISGKIRVSSEIGIGTSIFFTLPLIAGNNTDIEKTVLKENNNRGVVGQILVAEDDETNFFYLNAILSRETDASIIHANNGKEAVELFEANPGIQLVLMDIKMPVMDGFEATRQIKLINKDVPVIAITAYAMMGDKERVLAAGCDEYLSKPISKKLLLQKVSELIDL